MNSEQINQFGDYWLLRLLGTGGLGEIWLARPIEDSTGRQICIIKRPLPQSMIDPASSERFLDEIRLSARLNHRNIARVLDMGEVEGVPFFAMEYVEGKSLRSINALIQQRGSSVPMSLALFIGMRICDALAYAHREVGPNGRPLQLVHRGICPENILISYKGVVKLIDFGTAHSTIKEVQTLPGRPLGNLAYMSPEQARHRAVDGRSDIYSLGAVLWELFSGVTPQLTNEQAERWLRSGRPRFVSPSKHRPSVPREVDYAIMRALSNDPRERQQKAAELQGELKRILEKRSPQTSSTDLSAFMKTLFETVAVAERRQTSRAIKISQTIVPESLEDSETDPEATVAGYELSAEEMADLHQAHELAARQAIKRRRGANLLTIALVAFGVGALLAAVVYLLLQPAAVGGPPAIDAAAVAAPADLPDE